MAAKNTQNRFFSFLLIVSFVVFPLGFGSYAVVRLVQDKHTKDKFALKTYDKLKLADPQKRKNVAREVKILSKIKHPNIIRLYDVIETDV
jgi:serine/threonine protein kinase